MGRHIRRSKHFQFCHTVICSCHYKGPKDLRVHASEYTLLHQGAQILGFDEKQIANLSQLVKGLRDMVDTKGIDGRMVTAKIPATCLIYGGMARKK